MLEDGLQLLRRFALLLRGQICTGRKGSVPSGEGPHQLLTNEKKKSKGIFCSQTGTKAVANVIPRRQGSSLVGSQTWHGHPHGSDVSVISKQELRGDGLVLHGFREPPRPSKHGREIPAGRP